MSFEVFKIKLRANLSEVVGEKRTNELLTTYDDELKKFF